MNARIEVAPELLGKARYLYEHTLAPVDDIAAMLGMSKTPFYRRVQQGGWTPRRVRFAAGEFARAIVDNALMSADAISAGGLRQADAREAAGSALGPGTPASAAEPVDRVALAASLMKSVERHIAAVERVCELIGPTNPVEAERSARTLAVMGRALREISILLRPARDASNNDTDDDSVSIDTDEYRRELAATLDRLLDAERRRESPGDRGPESAGD